MIHYAQTLGAVSEAGLGDLVQRIFSYVAEGRVTQIVTVGHGLGEVLVEIQCPGDGSGDLGHFQRVGKAGNVVIPCGGDEHLGLVL